MQNPGRGPSTQTVIALGAAVLVGILALLLIIAPPPTTSGPIYTGEKPVDTGRPSDLLAALSLLPLTIGAVLLVATSVVLIPFLVRRRGEGGVPGDPFAMVIKTRTRILTERRLTAVRYLLFGSGAVLTIASLFRLIPALIERIAAGRPGASPTPTPDPGVLPIPSGASDPAGLIALASIAAMIVLIIVVFSPALRSRLRLPSRRRSDDPARRYTEARLSGLEPAPFEAPDDPRATGLPPELAALLPPAPRIPGRLELTGKALFSHARASVALLLRGGRRVLLLLTSLIVGLTHRTVRTVAAAGRSVAAAARALVRAILAALRWTGRSILAALRWTGGSIVAALRWTGRSIVAALRWTRHSILAALRWAGHSIVAGVYAISASIIAAGRLTGHAITTVVRGARRATTAAGHGIRRLAVAGGLLLLRLGRLLIVTLSLAAAGVYWTVVTAGALVVIGSVRGAMAVERLVRATNHAMAALATGAARGVVAAAHLISRGLKAIGRAITVTGGGVRERIRRVARGAHPRESQFDVAAPCDERAAMTHPVTILVVALAPQSGKSTVATEAARLMGTTWINSSAVIAERLEERLSLPAGRIAETRKLDHEAYRPALIEEGNRMVAEGTSPGVECVRRGYRVIDGIRRRDELEAAIAEIRARGGRSLVICVRRPDAPALTDNTEAAALAALADATIANDGSLTQLRRRTAVTLRRHAAY